MGQSYSIPGEMPPPKEAPAALSLNDDDPARALLKRVIKDKADLFDIEYIEQDKGLDVFEIESSSDKTRITLRGNNGVSVASALNHYLKTYCNCDITWNGTNITIPSTLPVVPSKIHITSPYKYRYYLNYCTFCYSAVWWDWERWQWEIDWMAMNGINMPLAMTGEEAIWQEVYKEMGFTNDDLKSFFSGPAYFAWLYMGNLDGWGGPLPQSWIQTHKVLQRQIVQRERSLGMKTVLPAFTGHVPPSFPAKYPNAKVKKTNWDAGFADVYILDPEDPLFTTIGGLFLTAQTKEYGTDHFYSADTFNENVPPTDDPAYLKQISGEVYKSMTTTDPDAVWVMQGWMFHYNSDFWKAPQIEGLLSAVPDDKMIILDLYSEEYPVWKQTEAYYGKQWIWNMLQNFGGRVAMFGRMSNVAQDPAAALADPNSKNLTGIGLCPEAIEQNPVIFELMLENVWSKAPIDIDSWLKGYIIRRYGGNNDALVTAWGILKNTVYSGGLTEGGAGTIICARPTFDKDGYRVFTEINYDPLQLAQVWKTFVSLSAAFTKSEGYRYDLVDITRQVLANYSNQLQQQFAAAYQKKDMTTFNKLATEFLGLIDDMEKLLATHTNFLLGKWISDARKWGMTTEEQNLYEFNARDLVTLWGDKDSPLHEYSNRQWSGLMKDFYKPRWQKFFDSVKSGKLDSFDDDIKIWEWNWVNAVNGGYSPVPVGNSFVIAGELFAKYYSKIVSSGVLDLDDSYEIIM